MNQTVPLTFSTLKNLLAPSPSMGRFTEAVDIPAVVRLLFVYIGSGGKIGHTHSYYPGVDNAHVTSYRNRTITAGRKEEAVYNHHRFVDVLVVSKSNMRVSMKVVDGGIRSVGLVHRPNEMKAISTMKANGITFAQDDVQEVLLKGGWAHPRLLGPGSPLHGVKCGEWAVRLYNLDRDFERLLSVVFMALDGLFGGVFGCEFVKTIAWEVADGG